jgi:hypothetical protein
MRRQPRRRARNATLDFRAPGRIAVRKTADPAVQEPRPGSRNSHQGDLAIREASYSTPKHITGVLNIRTKDHMPDRGDGYGAATALPGAGSGLRVIGVGHQKSREA